MNNFPTGFIACLLYVAALIVWPSPMLTLSLAPAVPVIFVGYLVEEIFR